MARRDTIHGGPGNDVIFAWNRPAGMDLVVWGSGYDRVATDSSDEIARDCEKVSVYHRKFPNAFFDSIPESFWEGLPQYPEGAGGMERYEAPVLFPRRKEPRSGGAFSSKLARIRRNWYIDGEVRNPSRPFCRADTTVDLA